MASRKPASPAFRSRTSETYARIREAVISARFAPGTKLKIEELCSALEVGATPVREALSYLAADGLVVREEQRGFRVADISAQEFEDLLHVRCNVEERALRLAIERGDSVWEENIVSARYRLETLERPRGYNGAWEEAHRRFHLALNAACGSNILLRLCNQFYDENDRYRHIARSRSEESRDIAVEHEAIAEAALARDADEAVRQLLAHYRRTGEMLHRALVAMAGESDAPVSGARSGNGKGIQWQGV